MNKIRQSPPSFPTGCKIETASINHDLKRIALIINLAYQEKHAYLKDNAERVSLEELLEMIRDPHKKLYLYLNQNNEICGTVLLHLPDTTSRINKLFQWIFPKHFLKDDAEIGLLAVHPDHQRKKIGSILMEHAEHEAFSTYRMRSIKLLVVLKALIVYYQSLGYKDTGLRKKFIDKTLRYLRPEWKDKVIFTILKKQSNLHG